MNIKCLVGLHDFEEDRTVMNDEVIITVKCKRKDCGYSLSRTERA